MLAEVSVIHWECMQGASLKLTSTAQLHRNHYTYQTTACKMSSVISGPVLAAAIAPIVGNNGFPFAAATNAEAPALPSGFPSELRSKLAWTGADFADEHKYILCLTETDLAEVKQAIAEYKCRCTVPRLLGHHTDSVQLLTRMVISSSRTPFSYPRSVRSSEHSDKMSILARVSV